MLIYTVNLDNTSKAKEDNEKINWKLDQIKEKVGIEIIESIPAVPQKTKQKNHIVKCKFLKTLVIFLLFFGFVLTIVSIWLSLPVTLLGTSNSENPSACSIINNNNPNFTYYNYNSTNSTTNNYQINNFNKTNESLCISQNSQNVGIHNPILFIICFCLAILFLILAFKAKWVVNNLHKLKIITDVDANDIDSEFG